MSLAQHVGHFSTSLRGFSEHVSGGVDELRRCANARACNGRAPHPPGTWVEAPESGSRDPACAGRTYATARARPPLCRSAVP